MSFLDVNGYQLAVQDGSAAVRQNRIGELSRSPRGVLRTSRRDGKNEHNGVTCYFNLAEADAVEGLLNGAGHSFPFTTGLESRTGLHPEPDYDGIVINLGTMTPQISGGLDITQAQFTLGYNAKLGDKWTIQWREHNGSTWRVCARTSSTGYLDGVETAGVGVSATWMSAEVVDGVVWLGYAGAGTLSRMTDLVILPYEISGDMASAFSSHLFSFSPLPLLSVSGDFADGETVLCSGQVTKSSFVQASKDPVVGWENNLKQIQFVLVES